VSPLKKAKKPCPNCGTQLDRADTSPAQGTIECPSCHRVWRYEPSPRIGKPWSWVEPEPVASAAEPEPEPEQVTSAAIPRGNGGDGEVRVEWAGERIVVRWFCGAERSFTAEDLRAALDNVVTVCELGDVWVHDRDTRLHSYSARVFNGDGPARFYGGEGYGTDNGSLPWEPFKAALEQALSAHENRKERVMT
jgi:predicted RNA-binding Zn-ribbon protein involved in translation (DUF1610 family)